MAQRAHRPAHRQAPVRRDQGRPHPFLEPRPPRSDPAPHHRARHGPRERVRSRGRRAGPRRLAGNLRGRSESRRRGASVHRRRADAGRAHRGQGVQRAPRGGRLPGRPAAEPEGCPESRTPRLRACTSCASARRACCPPDPMAKPRRFPIFASIARSISCWRTGSHDHGLRHPQTAGVCSRRSGAACRGRAGVGNAGPARSWSQRAPHAADRAHERTPYRRRPVARHPLGRHPALEPRRAPRAVDDALVHALRRGRRRAQRLGRLALLLSALPRRVLGARHPAARALRAVPARAPRPLAHRGQGGAEG